MQCGGGKHPQGPQLVGMATAVTVAANAAATARATAAKFIYVSREREFKMSRNQSSERRAGEEYWRTSDGLRRLYKVLCFVQARQYTSPL